MEPNRSIETSESVIELWDGEISLTDLRDGRLKVTVLRSTSTQNSGVSEVITDEPRHIVLAIAQMKGAGYVCDEIVRAQAGGYVENDLRRELLPYFRESRGQGANICDFGCGSGGSTLALRRIFPDAARIDGIEFDESVLKVADERMKQLPKHQAPVMQIFRQNSSKSLPMGLANYDLIVLSAVVEHMLPDERKALLPMLWDLLKPGGVMFLNSTPHRWFPVEAHTTGILGLNYLPAALALPVARALGKVEPSWSWDECRRHGIRGATELELVRFVSRNVPDVKHSVEIMSPEGFRDRVALWRSNLTPDRMEFIKDASASMLRGVQMLTGSVLTQNLALGLRKRA